MQHNRFPSTPDLIFVIVAPLAAVLGAVKLTQADGDLAAHIRMGNQILETAQIPSHSLASYTAATEPMIAHSWLSEVFFASLFRAGGLPLICVVVAMIIGLTHAMIALFLRRHGADSRWALMAALLSLAIASIHWLARPHLFSIAGSAVTIWLLESTRPKRQLYFLPVFALWANLHGGWLYGLAIIAMYTVGDLAEASLAADRGIWLARARRDAIALALAVVGTVINPFGLSLHREVISTVISTSLARNISEFLPANFQDLAQTPFLVALLLAIGLVSLSVRRMSLPWLAVILMSVFFALRSSRNIALFAVTGWPLVALHAANSFPSGRRRFPLFKEFARLDSNTRVGWLAAPVGVLLLLLGLNRGAVGRVQLIADHFDASTFPVSAVARARQAHLSGRVFDAWRWAGYIMYAWPEASVHVDPLKFSDRTLESYTIIEDLRPGWLAELSRWQVQTIIVSSRSPLARQLNTAPGWKLWYRDSTAVVFRASPGNAM
jgi:hypothetical protein